MFYILLPDISLIDRQPMIKQSKFTHQKISSIGRANATGVLTVCVIQLFLIKAVFLAHLPITDGWYLTFAHLSKDRVPYKDFYIPFPPGTLFFEGFLPSLFPNSFVGEQIIHVILWLILCVACFALARALTNVPGAVFATSISCALYFVQPGNIIAGYFETMYAFLLVAVACITKVLQQRHGLIYCSLAGISLGISTTIKQSVWLTAVAITVFLIILVKQHRLRFSQFVYFLCGATCPWIAVVLWSVYRGNTTSLLSGILTGGGKAVSEWSVLTTFGVSVLPQGAFIVLYLFLLLMLFTNPHNKTNISTWSQNLPNPLLVGVVLALGGVGVNSVAIENFVSTCFVLMGLITMVAVFSSRNQVSSDWNSYSRLRIVILFVALPLLTLAITSFISPKSPGLSSIRPTVSEWFSSIGALLGTSFIGVAAGALVVALYIFINRYRFSRMTSDLAALLLVVHLTMTLSNSIAGGDSIETWLLPLIVGLVLLSRVFQFYVNSAMLTFGSIALCLFAGSVGSYQVLNPYSWFQVTDAPLTASRRSVKVENIRFFRLDETSAKDYETLSAGLAEAIREKGKGTEVFFGSRNLGLAEMLSAEVFPTTCPVLWWDICPETLAKQDEIHVRATRPEIVIWTFEPEVTIIANEDAWRNRKLSAVRGIQGWLYDQIDSGHYRVLATTKKVNDLTRYQEVHTAVLVQN